MKTREEIQEKPEHTPGPWIADYRGVYTAKGTTDTEYGVMVVECPRMAGRYGVQEAVANAALIAAAPDMLELLEQLEWAGCDYLGNPICPKCEQRKTAGHYTDCDLAAAIKKAKGQQ